MTHKYVQRIINKKEKHKQRNILVRSFYVILGFLLGIFGLPLLFVFPEAGIPIILISLAILSLEFDWAGNILTWVSLKFDKLLNWLRKQPVLFHIILATIFIAIGILIFLLIN